MKAVIEILDGKGYVWDATACKWLRLECGILGAMVGGISVFKQQNAIHGPPLQLCKEEVTLLLEKNLAQLAPPLLTLQHLSSLNTTSTRSTRKRPYEYDPNDESYYEDEDDYNFDYYDDDDDDSNEKEENNEKEEEQGGEPAWHDAIADGAVFDVPTTVQDALSIPGNANTSNNNTANASSSITWDWPTTEQDLHNYLVFRDLHSQGFRISGGSKFGADFLLYPGDISLYHAQFCVRILRYDQAITPSVFSGILRGTHQARKHLLMASVVREEEEEEEEEDAKEGGGKKKNGTRTDDNDIGKGWKIHYTTVGPVDGFGTS